MEKDFEKFYESIANVVSRLDSSLVEGSLTAIKGSLIEGDYSIRIKVDQLKQSKDYAKVSRTLVRPWEEGAIAFQPGMDEMESSYPSEFYMKHGLLERSPYKDQLIEILEFIDFCGC